MYTTVAFAANILDFFVFFRPASGYYHPLANGCDYQAVAVCITCFFQHSVNVGSHRGFGHIQFCGNLGIGFSLTKQAQGFHLTVGQFAGKRIAELHTRYTVRPEALTRKSAVNYAHKVAGRRILIPKAVGADFFARSRNRPSNIDVTITIFIPG